MSEFLERIGLDTPVIQAGMGSGLAGAPLAAAVSAAGGLGTIGIVEPNQLSEEIAATRTLTDRPVAVNLLLPFARRPHFEAAREADVLVTFWGKPKRRNAGTWIHQCGSVAEALLARDAGADAVIAQGVESGGHVRGAEPALALYDRVRAAVGAPYPVLSAGGIVSVADVRERLDAGVDAVVSGTRFLMTDESGAHPAYKERLIGAHETLLTELFGLGWPAQHRVVPNAATERWLRRDPRGPRWVRPIHRLTSTGASRVPVSVQVRLAATQSPSRPFFGAAPATAGGPDTLVDAGPLYAGESVARIDDIRPAAEIVRDLTP